MSDDVKNLNNYVEKIINDSPKKKILNDIKKCIDDKLKTFYIDLYSRLLKLKLDEYSYKFLTNSLINSPLTDSISLTTKFENFSGLY